MTKSEEKLIAFTDILYASARSCKCWLSMPNPEKQKLRFEYPRIVSNTLFDNTSSFEFCVQKIYHKKGKFRKREATKERIEMFKKYLKEARKNAKHYRAKYHKGKFIDLALKEEEFIAYAEPELKKLKELKIGPSDKMVEHSNGREQAATYMLEWILQNNAEWVDIKKEEDPQKVQEILNHTRELLKRFSFTVWLEKHEGLHTKANDQLEAIQKGNLSWESYKEILSNLGYEDLSEELRPRFEAAKIDLKYFTK